MLINVPRFCLKNPAVVALFTLAVCVFGLYNYCTMPRREDPEIRVSLALVVSIYPGAGTEQVETRVTRKLEDRIGSLDGLKEMHSTSRENLSVIFVTVRYDANTDIAWQKLRALVQETKSELPAQIIGPQVIDDFSDTTGMLIAFSGRPAPELARLAKALRQELRQVSSVGVMSLYGEQREAIYVEGTRATMSRYGLTPIRVAEALKMRNVQIPAGAIRTAAVTYQVQPTGAIESAQDLRQTILDVSTETGLPVHLGDLFTVRPALETPAATQVLLKGQTAVLLGLVMRRGENLVAMGQAVREVLERFRTTLPAGVALQVVHDSPRQVKSQVHGFVQNLMEGLFLVVLVMAITIGLRSALISAVAIPLSLLFAFVLMPLLHIDLELVSIAAFIVALGMLVDDNIIVVDNTDVLLRQGVPLEEAAWRGPWELRGPVIGGTLSTAVSFLPMLLLTGETGAYVRSLPLTVTVAILGSLVFSLTVTPLVLKRALAAGRERERSFFDERVGNAYRHVVRACLRSPRLVLCLSALALAGAGGLLYAMGFSFFPDANRDQFVVEVWLKEGTAVERTEQLARQVDAALRADKDVTSSVVYVGAGGPRFYITVLPEFQKANYAQIMVNTRHAKVTHRVIERFNQKVHGRFPGARVYGRKLVMGMPIAAPIALRIVGPDIRELARISNAMQTVLSRVPGTAQVRDDVGPEIPHLRVVVDGERANRAGVTHTDVALAFLATHQGFELTRFYRDDTEVPVVLRLVAAERDAERGTLGLPVASNITGKKVQLENIASTEAAFGPGVIRRHNNRRCVTVLAQVEGRLASAVLREALPALRKVKLLPGYHLEFSGEKKELDHAFAELLFVFAVIFTGLLAMLLIQLKTFKKALVVLSVVPLSLVGASIGLYIGGYSFSFMAFLGVSSLCGIVIKDSLLWLEFVEQAQQTGGSQFDCLVEARLRRMRPILLTTVTAVGGLLPLGFFGGVLFEPMAWAMIAGLISAAVLTLVVVPVFYSVLHREREAG